MLSQCVSGLSDNSFFAIFSPGQVVDCGKQMTFDNPWPSELLSMGSLHFGSGFCVDLEGIGGSKLVFGQDTGHEATQNHGPLSRHQSGLPTCVSWPI